MAGARGGREARDGIRGDKRCAWTCHPIERELSAYYDITHGVGLAIVTPRWMRYALSDKTVGQFAAYAVNVWGIDPSMERFAAANAGIDATERFFRSIGIPMTLGEAGIGSEHFRAMAEHAVKVGGLSRAFVPLGAADVENSLRACL